MLLTSVSSTLRTQHDVEKGALGSGDSPDLGWNTY